MFPMRGGKSLAAQRIDLRVRSDLLLVDVGYGLSRLKQVVHQLRHHHVAHHDRYSPRKGVLQNGERSASLPILVSVALEVGAKEYGGI